MTTPTVTEIRRHGAARPVPGLATVAHDDTVGLGAPGGRTEAERAPFPRVARSRASGTLCRAA